MVGAYHTATAPQLLDVTGCTGVTHYRSCAGTVLPTELGCEAEVVEVLLGEHEVAGFVAELACPDVADRLVGEDAQLRPVAARSSTGVSYPRMAWDGDSKNTVPVAELHNKLQGSSAARIALAEARVAELVQTKIAPAFAAAYDAAIHKIETEFISFEGDSLHQVVDCVVLGPYASADMLPRHRTLRNAFPAPQYHRGSPKSREIMYDVRTQGSTARKRIMQEVVRHVSATTSDTRPK
jgi:hypothetical protein